MARGEVFLHLPGREGMEPWAWRTDLTGHGGVGEGQEFTARELVLGKLRPGGRKLRVRVLRVEKRGRSFHVLHVEVLADLTPPPAVTRPLFG